MVMSAQYKSPVIVASPYEWKIHEWDVKTPNEHLFKTCWSSKSSSLKVKLLCSLQELLYIRNNFKNKSFSNFIEPFMTSKITLTVIEPNNYAYNVDSDFVFIRKIFSLFLKFYWECLRFYCWFSFLSAKVIVPDNDVNHFPLLALHIAHWSSRMIYINFTNVLTRFFS